MNVSVILCTYNRCDSLLSALESVAASAMPDSIEWEVLVVDNNSKDQTRARTQDFCARHGGRFRYLYEDKPGKSNALNAGIRAAKGDVLAFVDDDVTVDPMWLQNLTTPFLKESWAGVGGRILPVWPCSPPPWMPLAERRFLAPLAMFDLGSEAGPLEEPPFGTNMAFRKQAFEKYKGFRCDLGPQPGSEIRSEDTEFGRRLLLAGERLWYAPSAIVHHQVTAARLEERYFLHWWFDKGRADVREFWNPNDSTHRLAGIPPYMLRRVVHWTLRWMLTFGTARRFSCKLKTWWLAGEIVESYRLWRTSTPRASVPQEEFQVGTIRNG